MVKEERGWTLEIKPKAGLFDLHLNELWRYKDLIALFVRRDFLANYKQTILGPLWFLIQPVLTTLMFYLIFSKVAKIKIEGVPPIVFYLCGLTCWNYFSACVNKTSNIFSNNSQIFGKVYFPRLAVPVSIILSTLITFSIQFALLLTIMLLFAMNGTTFSPNAYMLLLPFLLLLLSGLSLGTGIIFSSLTIKYKDFGHLITFGLQLGMYATPIIYPLTLVPSQYKVFVLLNPVTSIVEAFRYSIMGVGSINTGGLIYSTLFTFISLGIGALVFSKAEKNFMDVV